MLFKKPQPAWLDPPDLPALFEQIDAIVTKRTVQPVNPPSFTAEDLDAIHSALPFGLPIDLRAFLAWLNRDAWTTFTNPDQSRRSDRPVMTTGGEMITPGHPQDTLDYPLCIHESEDFAEWTVANTKDVHLNYIIGAIKENENDPRWLDVRLLNFGQSTKFEHLYYVLESPFESQAGSIAISIADDPALVIVAGSLAQWLAKLVATGGIELVIGPNNEADIPKHIRKPLVKEFNYLNPKCNWFG